MELVISILRACASLAALLAVALAYESHDKVKKLEEKVDYLAEQLYEVPDGNEVGSERNGGE